MDDLIKRCDVLEDIDEGADLLRTVLDEMDLVGSDREEFEFGLELLGALIDYIKQIPSAEPEIIRCKDCEHWDTTWQNDFAPNYHYCPLVDGTRRDDFYCADAERRGEG